MLAHTRDDRSVLLVLTGEIDIARVESIRSAGLGGLTGDGAELVLDMMDVTFIDSAGIGCLVALRNAAAKVGGRLVLLDPSHAVTRILDITKLTPVFEIHRTR